MRWLFENDGAFRLPYDTSLNALLTDSSFKRGVPQGIVLKAELIRKQGQTAPFTTSVLSVTPTQ